ncbi:MAG: hypothetical protein OHK0038_00390 [Flammeovirgaceae bacterium]
MEENIENLHHTAKLIRLDIQAVIPEGVYGLEKYEFQREMFKAVTLRVLEMMKYEFEQLVDALYRIDVSEEMAKKAFLNNSEIEIAQELARLIIERESQKVQTRMKYAKK